MTRHTQTPRTLAAVLLIGALTLSASGCGRMADPTAPPAKRTERSMRSASADSLPEPATINRPNRTAPMDGISNPYDGAGNDPR